MKVLFLGTAEFACLSLEAILTSRHKVAAVVTQPDRPKGRGRRLASSPVKFLAAKKNIPVFQPEKLRDPAALEILRSFHPDLIVVVAYGQILSSSVLSIPPRGCVNVHASLLPQYRGAAPIPWAILKGEQRTGVATMLMDSGLDTGPILLTEETPIAPEDTAGVLHDRLAIMGATLLLKTLDGLERETIAPRAQDHSRATYAPKIAKEDGRIDWNMPARELFNRLRAFDPWPGAFTRWGGRNLKIFRPGPVEEVEEEIRGKPGTVAQVSEKDLTIATARGCLRVREVQLENRPRMGVAEFLRGYPLKVGELLGG